MSSLFSNKRRLLLARWGLVTILVTVAVVGAVTWVSRPDHRAVSATGGQAEGVTSVLRREAAGAEASIRFVDVTDSTGIAFKHFPGVRASALPEDMGSGVACGDYDNDGLPDLFFVNFSTSIASSLEAAEKEGISRLYRNLGDMRFEDVTDSAGVGLLAYGMGAAWGDSDNDGDLDLYVTAYGPNVLYENRGNGTFVDVTAQAGVQDTGFSAGCSWADYDRDGDLDLYVCNYVDFVLREGDRGRLEKQYGTEQPYTLNPSSYPPVPNRLFRNRGDGTFEEVAEALGVADPTGRSLSASWADLNNDGWADLYVANDVSKNAVFMNLGDGAFKDVGASSLAADYRGAMGIAVGDFDDDLDQDLLITHWIAQENALYRNMTTDTVMGPSKEDRLWFLDAADEWGLGQISLDMIGWATGFCDFDNDGQRDLWLVNGSTFENADDHRSLGRQRAFLFQNTGEDSYVDMAELACPRMREAFVGRGGAQADLDGDGRVDLVMVAHRDRPMLLRNESRVVDHFLRLQLRQRGGNAFALGARAYVTTCGTTRMAEVGCSSSYLSQDELTLHFGLGDCDAVDSVRIVWPDGAEETIGRTPVDKTIVRTHDAAY